MVKKVKEKKKQSTTYKTFSVDLSDPLRSGQFTVKSCIKYLESNFKVNGTEIREANRQGDKEEEDKEENKPIKISAIEKNSKIKNTVLIQVDNKLKFSKKNIKLLVKKFLREKGTRYLTVFETSPNEYSVKGIKKKEK